MAELSETERIEILMIVGYEGRQSYQYVWDLFNNVHPEENPIVQSTVSKSVKKILNDLDIT